jgi:uncharacterized protein (DUF305 family)
MEKSCFTLTQTQVGSKNKAGLTAIVVRILTAAGKATSFHDLPGKQQAACKAMRQHLTQMIIHNHQVVLQMAARIRSKQKQTSSLRSIWIANVKDQRRN